MDNYTKISIGLFGDSYMLNQIRLIIKQFPSFDPFYFECHAENIKDSLLHSDASLEVALLFDYDSFLKVNDLDFSFPVHFLYPSASSLYRILYMNANILDAVDVLSVDSLSEPLIKNLLKETAFLGELKMASSTSAKNEPLIHQHMVNIDGFNYPMVLTASKRTFFGLTEIPKNFIYPTDQDMIVALERALLSTETRRKKEHQAVVGSIRIQKGEPQLLEKLANLVDGHLVKADDNHFVLTSRRGIFERVTQGYKYLPLISGNEDAVIHMGIGFHVSNKQAGLYSKIALEHALAFKKSACYVVREDQSVFGPIAFGSPATYHTIVTNAEAIKEAKQVGMTAVHMDRLKAFLLRKEAVHFTANDFAIVSDITLRSAHRILLKWQDANLVDIAGQEKTNFKGRPKVVYKFTERTN
jgi:hypothetical protein